MVDKPPAGGLCWCGAEARPVNRLLVLQGMSLLEDWGNVRGIAEGYTWRAIVERTAGQVESQAFYSVLLKASWNPLG